MYAADRVEVALGDVVRREQREPARFALAVALEHHGPKEFDRLGQAVRGERGAGHEHASQAARVDGVFFEGVQELVQPGDVHDRERDPVPLDDLGELRLVRNHGGAAVQQAQRQVVLDDHAGQAAEQQVPVAALDELDRVVVPALAIPGPVRGHRLVRLRAAFGQAGASAGVDEPGHIVRLAREQQRLVLGGQQFGDLLVRGDEVDAIAQDVVELLLAEPRPDPDDTRAEREGGQVGGQRFRRHVGDHRDAGALLDLVRPHPRGDTAGHAEQFGPRDLAVAVLDDDSFWLGPQRREDRVREIHGVSLA
jgi:hypothetical protein